MKLSLQFLNRLNRLANQASEFTGETEIGGALPFVEIRQKDGAVVATISPFGDVALTERVASD